MRRGRLWAVFIRDEARDGYACVVTHGSFLASRRANVWLGTLCGLLVLTPFVRWRHDHAVHHATPGDLDKRGVGDLPTLTVAEYHQRSRKAGSRR